MGVAADIWIFIICVVGLGILVIGISVSIVNDTISDQDKNRDSIICEYEGGTMHGSICIVNDRVFEIKE